MMYRNPTLTAMERAGRVLAVSAAASLGLLSVEGCGGSSSTDRPRQTISQSQTPVESPRAVIANELAPSLTRLAVAAWGVAPADGRDRSFPIHEGSRLNRYEIAFRLPQHQAVFFELNAQGTKQSFDPATVDSIQAALVEVPKGETALPTSPHLKTLTTVIIEQAAGKFKVGVRQADPEESFMTPPNSVPELNLPGTIEERPALVAPAALDAVMTIQSALQSALASAPQPLNIQSN